MKPWIEKKMVEYLGEEEPTLIDFIITKLQNKCHPNDIYEELEPILDTEANIFVIKLWRMLIYNVLVL